MNVLFRWLDIWFANSLRHLSAWRESSVENLMLMIMID